MNDMIERVAFAISQAESDFDGVALIGSAFPEKPTPKMLAAARAAIEAMREPTFEVANAFYGQDSGWDIWRDMIDAALSPSRT